MITAPRSVSFGALGTTAVVATAHSAALAEAEAILRHELDRIERACSRFREDSELSALNRAPGEDVAVGPLLLEAIRVALRAAAITGGDVDPTVGRAMGELGYDRDFSRIEAEHPRVRVRYTPVPGWRTVRINANRGTVSLPAGVQLDLGATAKALAADRAARAIHDSTRTGVLVSLGGDIALAGEPPVEGWPIRVTDDHRDLDGDGETISLRSGGLATSSTTVRRWVTGEDTRHHVLDPSSGAPAAEIWRTVSVAAATCVDANTASTASIVRGATAPEWLARSGLPARLVSRGGEVVRVGGWPDDPR